MLFVILTFLLASVSVSAQTWIWFPGDYENWLGNQMNNKSTERGVMMPVQWKLDGHEPLMIFTKEADLAEPEEIEVYAEGEYIVTVEWRIKYPGNVNGPTKITLSAGKNENKIKVINYAKVPAIYVKGKAVNSDESWMASSIDSWYMTKNIKHPDSPSGYYMNTGSEKLINPKVKPSEFKLPKREIEALSEERINNGRLIDFGMETFGFIKFHELYGSGEITLQYG